jgi:sarcosine oxidase
MMSDDPGFKIGFHFPGRVTDPDDIDARLLDEEEATYRSMLQRLVQDADGPVVAHRVCLYTNSADGHFIVDRHPRHANVVIACGLSGHGFKFAPVMGKVLAELAIDGASALPVSFLGLDRFSQA